MSRSLTQRVGWVALGRLSNIASLLIVNALLSRLLPLAEYGRYQQVWLVLNLCVPIFVLGLPSSLNAFLQKQSEDERDRFLTQTVFLLFFPALLLAGLLALGAPTLAAALKDPTLAPLFRSASLLGFVLIATGFWDAFLINYSKHRWLAVSYGVFSAAFLIAVLAGAFLGKSIEAIFLALGVYSLVRLAGVAFVVWKVVRPRRGALRADSIREQARFVLPVTLRESLDAISRWCDKVIITSRFRPDQFAVYYNGAQQIPFVGLFVDSIFSVAIPDYASAHHRGDKAEIKRLFGLTARRIAFVIFPLTAASIAVAPDAMAVLFGGAYHESGRYFRVFLTSLPCRISSAGFFLLAAGRSDWLLYGTILDIVLAIGLGMALIPTLGLFGPAVASVLATYIQASYNLRQAGRAVGVPARSLLPWKSLARLALLSAAAGLVSSFGAAFQNPLANVVCAGGVFLVFFAGVGLGMHALEAEERALVARWLGAARRLVSRRGIGTPDSRQ